MSTTNQSTNLRVTYTCLSVLVMLALPACDGEGDPDLEAALAADELGEDLDTLTANEAPPTALTSSELSQLVLGGAYTITNGYAPNGKHAGVDFGGTSDGITSVASPVHGTILANTSACGKVAIFDGSNTIIMAHMTSLTTLPVGSTVSIGTYLGKVSKVVGGGCSVTGPHLHMEIRTGQNTSMALPTADNTGTTRDPLSYGYSAFAPVTLLTPASGASLQTSPVWLEWKSTQGAVSYRLQISKTNAFTASTCSNGCVIEDVGPSTNRSFNLGVGTYYWRVRAGNSGQGGEWSPVRWFKKI